MSFINLPICILPRCPSLPLGSHTRPPWRSHTFSHAIFRTTSFQQNMSSAPAVRKSKGPIIISGYPCIGKTFFCQQQNSKLGAGDFAKIQVVDLDSSAYSRDRFPANYLEDIRRTADKYTKAGEACIILVSTFPGVGTKLREEGFYVSQVYPQGDHDTKAEWLRRLEHREKGGKESRLYRLVDQHWDEWYDGMEERLVSKTVKLSSDEYLSNVVDGICQDFGSSEKDLDKDTS